MSELNITTLTNVIPEDVQSVYEKPPMGIIEWAINGLVARTTEPNDGRPGRLVLEASLTAVSPESASGLSYDETFWIGTDDDPMAQQLDTWKKEASRLTKFCEEAGFNPRGAAPAQIAEWLKGRKILSDVRHYLVPTTMANGQPNPRAFDSQGHQRSKVVMRWMREGAATPALDESQTPHVGRQAAQTPAQAPAPAAPAAYPTAPQAPAPVAPQAHAPAPTAAVNGPSAAPSAVPPGFPSAAPPAAPPPAPPRAAR